MRIALGLGSNQGDRARNLKRAVVRLTHGPDPVLRRARLARVYASPALVPPGAPEGWSRPYLNTALLGETGLTPERLLARVRAVERALGRGPGERWAPRPMDVDLLWWEGGAVERPELTIPHPEIVRRSFVLEPLRDLLPDLVLQGATVAEHARRRRAEEAEPAERDEAAERGVLHPILMGILNVTPDSFSDGGRYLDPDEAAARAERLLDQGAEILDVGGESTRPDGTPVEPEAERRRLEPVLGALAALRTDRSFRLSLDSRRPRVVAWGLERGVDMVNDVTGLADPEMRAVVRDGPAELVLMHSLSVPVVRGEALPRGRDPVALLAEWAEKRVALLESEGIGRERLHLDPGIGFGKSAEQSWELLDRVEELHDAGLPLLVGHSRKSFLGAVTGLPPGERDAATVAVSLQLSGRGVETLRVHDPGLHARRFRAAWAARSEPWVAVGPQSSSLTRPSSSE